MRVSISAGVLLLLGSLWAAGDDFYVSPGGDNANPGTLAEPWQTIEHARDTLRSLPLPEGGVTVWLREGTWYVEQTIVFDERDSGTSDKPVRYKAYPLEHPVFCGGREISGWTDAGGGVFRAPVDPAHGRFEQLFENGVRQVKARYPNNGYLRTDHPTSSPKRKIRFKSGQLPEWSDSTGAQISIWTYANWFESILPIAEIDYATRIMTLAKAGPQLNLAEDRYFIQGVHEALDKPGEFHLDEPNGYLYYWPRALPLSSQVVVAPAVSNVFAFVGSSPTATVEHVTLDGLTVWCSRFTDAFRDGGFISGPFYSVNRPGDANRQGLVQLQHAAHITIRDCHLSRAGFCGINLGYYAASNTVAGNTITGCGWHGILMAGHDNGDGVVNSPSEQIYDNKFNTVSNNHIHACGAIAGDAAGIYLYQSGDNDIAHNLVHNMPRYGICAKGHGGLYRKYTKFGNVTINDNNYWSFYTGNNNLIRYNHVYDLLNDTYDAGGISFKRPGRFNRITGNRIHDINPPANMDHHFCFGVYLDGGTTETTISNNVIYNVKPRRNAFATPLNIKKVRNRVINNIIVAETGATGGVLSMIQSTGEPESEGYGRHVIRRNVFYAKGSSATFYRFNAGEFACSMVSASDDNLFHLPDGGVNTFKNIDGDDTWVNWLDLCTRKFDQNSRTSNPRFIDPVHHDYNLAANSPAYARGFQEIDQDRAGLLAGFPVAHSPKPYDGQSDGTFADILTWEGATDATAFGVYFGSDPDAVAVADPFSAVYIGQQAHTSFAPVGLDTATRYYWRVDEFVGTQALSHGAVWSFRTIEPVLDPTIHDLIATNAGSTLDINTQTATITYDPDGGGAEEPLIFGAVVDFHTATWTFGDLHIGSGTTLSFSGDNRNAIRFIANGQGPRGTGDILIEKTFSLNGANGGQNGDTGGKRTFASGAGGDDDVGAEVRAGESGASDAYTTTGGIGSGRHTDSSTDTRGGGGGGFGGRGGDSLTDSPRGGSRYGRLDLAELGTKNGPRAGSGGGASNRGSGGAGGGAIQLLAVNDVTIASGISIRANGGRGNSAGSTNGEKRRTAGGGSGGAIRIVADLDRDGFGQASTLGVNLRASGGVSDNATTTIEYGGGGGGGRILVRGASVNTGPIDVSGGQHDQGRVVTQGENGSLLLDERNGTLSLSGHGRAENAYTSYTSLYVSADSNLEVGGAGAVMTLVISNSAPVLVRGTLSLELDGENAASDSLRVAQELDISGATLNLSPFSALDHRVLILASYGSLTGRFMTTNGLPEDLTVAYDHGATSNQIALVQHDADGDGMFDAWERERFASTTFSDGTGHSDADHYTDLEEFIADTDPLDANDFLWLEITATTSNLLKLRLPTSPLRDYVIERSVELDAREFTPAIPPFSGNGSLMQQEVPRDSQRLYYRVGVMVP